MQAEIIEIDENLCRSELTASQRSSYTKRRKVIWEAMHPPASQKPEQAKDVLPIEANSGTSGSTIPERGRGRPPEFAAVTAAATGMTKQAINRHIARAEALGDDLDRLVGTSLDAFINLPMPECKELIERAVLDVQSKKSCFAFQFMPSK
ncbi:hypothetical protein [Polaromonas glacialis]|uniref:hypothetical protein n=1 Tax=Polaromonas glacialis TaxID=866564 RepID=UPI000495EEE7|nr:hypothetical protein [Polaromonas glacialis]